MFFISGYSSALALKLVITERTNAAPKNNFFISLSPLVKDEGILAGISRSKKKSHPEVACQYTQQISVFRNQAEIYR